MAKQKKKAIVKKKKPASKVKKLKKTVKRKKVSPIPKGYRAITPYLIVNKGMRALEFYKKAFGAKVTVFMEYEGEKVGHAELIIGDSKLMLSDGCPEMNARDPEQIGGSPVIIHLYVKDVDTVANRAVSAGAKLLRPVADQFYGDRNCELEDPFGHRWCVASHVEDVTRAQITKRAEELFGKK